jgi:protein-arginine kinase activator protein McsA
MPIEPIDDEFIEEEVAEISLESDLSKISTNDLNEKLKLALETEDYESASKFRDEINRRG